MTIDEPGVMGIGVPAIVMAGGRLCMPNTAGSSGIVLVPTIRVAVSAAREIGVPENVIAGPPGRRVWPPITMGEPAVIGTGLPAMVGVMTGVSGPTEGSGMATVPIVRVAASGASEIGVPETVIGGPPEIRV